MHNATLNSRIAIPSKSGESDNFSIYVHSVALDSIKFHVISVQGFVITQYTVQGR